MAAPDKTYSIQVGDKIVHFIIAIYLRDGVVVTTFVPMDWTPPDRLDMPTSLDLARAVGERFRMDVDTVHTSIVRALADDVIEPGELAEKAELLAGFAESWQQAMSGNTRPIADLWDEINEDE